MARLVAVVKGVDWVGRWDDLQTVRDWMRRFGKWILAAVVAAWGWIMDNSIIMVYGPVVALLVIGLFGPVVFAVIREAHVQRRAERRRLEAARKWEPLRALLPDIEALADGLEVELEGEAPPSTVARNRATMRRLVTLFLAAEIDIPTPDDPSGQHKRYWLFGWMTFATNLATSVRTGDYNALKTLYRDVGDATKQHLKALDINNILRQLEREKGIPNDPENR